VRPQTGFRQRHDPVLSDVLGPVPTPAPIRKDDSGPRRPSDRPLFAHYQPERPPSRIRRAAAFVSFTLAAVFFGAVLGYQYAGGNMASLLPLTSPRIPVTNPYALSLSAERQGRSLLVKWNRHSTPVRTATRGTLTISEAGASRDVTLTPDELQGGVVLYPNQTGRIRIRLEVFVDGERSISETSSWSSGPDVE
jgi:hypothetical protein